MIDKSSIDPNALHYYRQLKEAGFSAYFVGGSVRDLLLGKRPKDFDIATNATPQQIKRVIPHGRIIGRRFRHVMLERNGGRYEIVTFRGPIPVEAAEAMETSEESPVDELSPAIESERGEPQEDLETPAQDRKERRHPDLNQFGTAEQDALRRDFTINALFYDPDLDELVDYVEGKLDVDRRIIRTIGSASLRMQEDPIRILRAIRHKIKLGLEYDGELESAMRERAPLLQETSKDRIREEFLKVCNDHSLGAFIQEAKRMGLVPYLMPWFENLSEEEWTLGTSLWEAFAELPSMERPRPEFGLALMMVPLISRLVIEPYRQSLSEGDRHHLPDMKYFLSCETLRDYYLRNLRISRAQTDSLVRTLFYFSRMTGLWLEQGPPRRVIGRLFQHPPAVLAAQLARFSLSREQKQAPDWLEELAQHDLQRRRRPDHRERGNDFSQRGSGRHRENEENEPGGDSFPEEGAEGAPVESREQQPGGNEERSISPAKKKINRLPPPDAPMIWNGPLHAPVLRPIFSEEAPNRWARKNQGARAFRPSGIPNQPLALREEKLRLVHNYKPELEEVSSAESQRNQDDGSRERSQRNRGRKRGRERDRGRGPRREYERDGQNMTQGSSEEENISQEAIDGPREDDGGSRSHEPRSISAVPPPPPSRWDPDSIGNIRSPGEVPAPLSGAPFVEESEHDMDDDIGNRLDRPPTSGHIGVNGEGVLGQRGQRPQRNDGHGRRNNNNRQRGRGRRGGRGGGQHRSGGPRGPQNPMS